MRDVTMHLNRAGADAAIERLRRIAWHTNPYAASAPELMREYLRRAALWARAVNCPQCWPFSDYGKRVVSPLHFQGLQLPGYSLLDDKPKYSRGADPLEDRILQLWQYLTATPRRVGGLHGHLCLWFVRWQALGISPLQSGIELPEPYEPLIVLFERGAWFSREHGYIDVGSTGFSPSEASVYAKSTPIVSLDQATLDDIDKIGKRDRKSGLLS